MPRLTSSHRFASSCIPCPYKSHPHIDLRSIHPLCLSFVLLALIDWSAKLLYTVCHYLSICQRCGHVSTNSADIDDSAGMEVPQRCFWAEYSRSQLHSEQSGPCLREWPGFCHLFPWCICTSTRSCLEEPNWTNPWIVTLQAALSGKGSRAHLNSLPAQTMATFTFGTVWRAIFPCIIFVWTSIDCVWFFEQMSLLLCNPSKAPHINAGLEKRPQVSEPGGTRLETCRYMYIYIWYVYVYTIHVYIYIHIYLGADASASSAANHFSLLLPSLLLQL